MENCRRILTSLIPDTNIIIIGVCECGVMSYADHNRTIASNARYTTTKMGTKQNNGHYTS